MDKDMLDGLQALDDIYWLPDAIRKRDEEKDEEIAALEKEIERLNATIDSLQDEIKELTNG